MQKNLEGHEGVSGSVRDWVGGGATTYKGPGVGDM